MPYSYPDPDFNAVGLGIDDNCPINGCKGKLKTKDFGFNMPSYLCCTEYPEGHHVEITSQAFHALNQQWSKKQKEIRKAKQ